MISEYLATEQLRHKVHQLLDSASPSLAELLVTCNGSSLSDGQLLSIAHQQYCSRQSQLASLSDLALKLTRELQQNHTDTVILQHRYNMQQEEIENAVRRAVDEAVHLEARLMEVQQKVQEAKQEVADMSERAGRVQAMYRQVADRRQLGRSSRRSREGANVVVVCPWRNRISQMEAQTKCLKLQLAEKNTQINQLDWNKYQLMDQLKAQSNRSLTGSRNSARLEDSLGLLLRENKNLRDEMSYLEAQVGNKKHFSQTEKKDRLKIVVRYSQDETLSQRKSFQVDTEMETSFVKKGDQQQRSTTHLKPPEVSEFLTFDTDKSEIFNSRLSTRSFIITPEKQPIPEEPPTTRRSPCPHCAKKPNNSIQNPPSSMLWSVFEWLRSITIKNRIGLHLRIDRSCRL